MSYKLFCLVLCIINSIGIWVVYEAFKKIERFLSQLLCSITALQTEGGLVSLLIKERADVSRRIDKIEIQLDKDGGDHSNS